MGDTKTGCLTPIYRFFFFFFRHVIRIVFVYSFKEGHGFLFFPSYFLAKTSGRIFLETAVYARHEKK